MAQARYSSTSNQMVRVDTDNPALLQIRTRVTAAQINAGLTLLPAVGGMAYRIVDIRLIAVGGAAAGATAVVVLGTRAAGSVTLMSVAVAGLTQSTAVDIDDAASAILADGASFTGLDVNTPVTIGKTGASLTGATNIDAIVRYALE